MMIGRSLDVNFCMYHPFGLKSPFHMCLNYQVIIILYLSNFSLHLFSSN